MLHAIVYDVCILLYDDYGNGEIFPGRFIFSDETFTIYGGLRWFTEGFRRLTERSFEWIRVLGKWYCDVVMLLNELRNFMEVSVGLWKGSVDLWQGFLSG